METNKLEAANPFSIFCWGTHREVEVVENRPLAAVIQAALNITWILMFPIFIVATVNIVNRLKFRMALGIMAFMIPCFLVFWRIVSIYRNAYNDDHVTSPTHSDTVHNVTLEKISTHV
ncbi:unnamed protein product [Urochloa humidicola]